MEKEIDVGIITETKLNEKVNIRISGYDIIREDREIGQGSGGVILIIIKKGIKMGTNGARNKI